MARRVNVADLLGKPAVDKEQAEQGGAEAAPERLVYVKTGRLSPNPHNPRDTVGDLSDLSSIAEIQRQSLLVVTRAAYLLLYPDEAEQLRGCDFVVVNGCRRHAAAVKYGREELACAVNDSVARSRAALLRAALDENVERKDLDPIEEAKAVMAIVAEYETAKAAAEAEGWTGAWISQRKSLLKLHPDLQAMVRAHAAGDEAGLSIRRARRLGSVKGIEELTADQQLAQLAAIEAADVVKKDVAKKDAAKVERAEGDGGGQTRPVGSAPAPGGAAAPAADGGGAEFTAVNSGPRPEPEPEAAAVPSPAGGAAAEGAPEPAAEFTAVNSEAPVELPEQRSAGSGLEEALVGLAASGIDDLAEIIFSALSLDDAYRLADALASKVLQASESK